MYRGSAYDWLRNPARASKHDHGCSMPKPYCGHGRRFGTSEHGSGVAPRREGLAGSLVPALFTRMSRHEKGCRLIRPHLTRWAMTRIVTTARSRR